MNVLVSKHYKKFFALFLAFVLTLPLVPSIAFAANDYSSHWAADSVERAVEMGWLTNSPNGTYRPNDSITRAEFVTMVNRMKGYTGIVDLSAFDDVKRSDWFYDAFAIAVSNGYIQGSDGKLLPNSPITRNEATVILAYISGLNTNADYSSILSNAKDASQIPSWAKASVGAAIRAGLVAGLDGYFNGSRNITRAETSAMLVRLHDNIRVYGFAGTYTGFADRAIITAPGVTLRDMSITGDLTIAPSVGDGEVYLDTVTIGGKLDINGGGRNSVYIKNSKIESVVVTKQGVRVVMQDGTEVFHAVMEGEDIELEIGNGVKLDSLVIEAEAVAANIKIANGVAINSVEVAAPLATVALESGARVGEMEVTASDTVIELNNGAKIGSITVTGEDTTINLASGAEISTVNINSAAKNTIVDLENGAKINTLNINGNGTEISGSGEISIANIKADGVVIEQQPERVSVSGGTTANVEGKNVSGTTEATSSDKDKDTDSSTSPGIYTVTFNLNGASGTAPAAQTVAAGGKATEPEEPSRTGFNFTGWYTTATTGSKWNFFTNTVAGDTTLYAGWSSGVPAVIGTFGVNMTSSVTPVSKKAQTIDVTGYVTDTDNVFTDDEYELNTLFTSVLDVNVPSEDAINNLSGSSFTAFTITNFFTLLQEAGITSGNAFYVVQTNPVLAAFGAGEDISNNSGTWTKEKAYNIPLWPTSSEDESFSILLKEGSSTVKLEVYNGDSKTAPKALTITINVTNLVLGTPVAKIGTTNYKTLSGALAAATSGQEVVLLDSLSTTAQTVLANTSLVVPSGKALTITSGTLTVNGALKVAGNATVSNSGTIAVAGAVEVAETAKITTTAGTIERTGSGSILNNGQIIGLVSSAFMRNDSYTGRGVVLNSESRLTSGSAFSKGDWAVTPLTYSGNGWYEFGVPAGGLALETSGGGTTAHWAHIIYSQPNSNKTTVDLAEAKYFDHAYTAIVNKRFSDVTRAKAVQKSYSAAWSISDGGSYVGWFMPQMNTSDNYYMRYIIGYDNDTSSNAAYMEVFWFDMPFEGDLSDNIVSGDGAGGTGLKLELLAQVKGSNLYKPYKVTNTTIVEGNRMNFYNRGKVYGAADGSTLVLTANARLRFIAEVEANGVADNVLKNFNEAHNFYYDDGTTKLLLVEQTETLYQNYAAYKTHMYTAPGGGVTFTWDSSLDNNNGGWKANISAPPGNTQPRIMGALLEIPLFNENGGLLADTESGEVKTPASNEKATEPTDPADEIEPVEATDPAE